MLVPNPKIRGWRWYKNELEENYKWKIMKERKYQQMKLNELLRKNSSITEQSDESQECKELLETYGTFDSLGVMKHSSMGMKP